MLDQHYNYGQNKLWLNTESDLTNFPLALFNS